MCKYNMRNDIGCKFLYDKTLIKIYDITGKICRTHNNWRIGAKRRFRGTCPERGGQGEKNGLRNFECFLPLRCFLSFSKPINKKIIQ